MERAAALPPRGNVVPLTAFEAAPFGHLEGVCPKAKISFIPLGFTLRPVGVFTKNSLKAK